MNISNINLNLLRVLDALLSESHVTQAGRKIGLSQSAISNALKQLRAIYQDELLVRGQGGQMRLTSLAESLKVPVRQALSQVEYALSCTEQFEPRLSEHTFHIGMSDYIEFVLLPSLIKHITKQAPKIKLVIHHLNYFEDPKVLENGQLDLVLGNFPQSPPSLMTQQLFTDSASFVARADHPISKKRKCLLKDILAYPLVMVSFVDDPARNFLDEMIKQHGYPPKVSVIVPHALIALQTLPNSDFITHTVKRIAMPLAKQIGLTLIKQPLDLNENYSNLEYSAQQYWHKIVNREPSHVWLRQIVKQVADEL